MLVFIDESGDPGLKVSQGSSRLFVVSLVVFEDDEEAMACDRRIALLRQELKWHDTDEFHFYENSDRIRRAFLEAVASYNFSYYCVVINKDPVKISPQAFKNIGLFHEYACGLLFEKAKEKLNRATVIIDRTGNLNFKRQLLKYLRQRMNSHNQELIKELKMQRSSSNNLLQLADYVSGLTNRFIQGDKKFATDYYKMISHRERYVQVWPK